MEQPFRKEDHTHEEEHSQAETYAEHRYVVGNLVIKEPPQRRRINRTSIFDPFKDAEHTDVLLG